MTNRSLQSLTAEMQKGVSDFRPGDTSPVDPGAVRNGPPWKTSSAKHQKVGWRAMWSSPAATIFVMFDFRDVFFFREKVMTSWCFHMRGLSFMSFVVWIYKYVLNHHIAIFTAWFLCGATSQDHPRQPVHFIFRTSELMKRTRFGARQMNSPVLNIPSKENNFWRWRALWLFFRQISSQFRRSGWVALIQLPLTVFGVWKWALKFSKLFSFKTISRVSSGFLDGIILIASPSLKAMLLRSWGYPGSVAGLAWYICEIHLLNHRWRVWWSASFKSIHPDSVVKKVKGQSQSLDLPGPQVKVGILSSSVPPKPIRVI